MSNRNRLNVAALLGLDGGAAAPAEGMYSNGNALPGAQGAAANGSSVGSGGNVPRVSSEPYAGTDRNRLNVAALLGYHSGTPSTTQKTEGTAAAPQRDFTASVPEGTPMVETDFGDVIPAQGYDWEQEWLDQQQKKVESAQRTLNEVMEYWHGKPKQRKLTDAEQMDFAQTLIQSPYSSAKQWGMQLQQQQSRREQRENDLVQQWAEQNPEEAENAVRDYQAEQTLNHYIRKWAGNETPENLRAVTEVLATPAGQRVLNNLLGGKEQVAKERARLEAEYAERLPGWNAMTVQSQLEDYRKNPMSYALKNVNPSESLMTEYIPEEKRNYDLAMRMMDGAQYKAETISALEQAIADARGTSSGKTAAGRFLHGLQPETLKNALTMGFGESEDLLSIARIAEKASRGETLTDGEQAAAGAYIMNLDATQRLADMGGATTAERVGNFIGDNAPFLLEMAATGGLGAPAAAAARGLIRRGIARGMKNAAQKGILGAVGKTLRNRVGRYVAKQGGNLVGAMAEGAVTSPLSTVTANEYANRTVDQYDVWMNMDGSIEAERTRPTSELERMYKSLATGAAERTSEAWGRYAGMGHLFPRFMRGTRIAKFTEPLRRLMQTPSAQRLDRYVGNVLQWNGQPMEWMEEQLSNVLQPLLTGELERIRENFSSEAQMETLLGVVAMGGVFQTMSTGAAAYDHVQSRRRSVGLLGHIQNPDLRQQVSRAMGRFTQKEQAKAISNIDWDNASLHDMAAATDYIMHRTQGRASQEIMNAMQEQTEAHAALQRFNKLKNQDTGRLEEVFDTQGRRYFLSGGALEKGDSGAGATAPTADGTLFVIDAETGEVSQKSVDELKRGQTTSYEEFEAGTLEAIRTVSAAQSEMETLQDIAEEAEATGDNPALRVADYMGIDLSTLTGKTVTLRDGSMAYVGNVSIPQNGTPDIDVVPLDPVTGMTQTGANGEEIHRPLDITEVAAVEGIPVGPETADAQTTPSEGEGVASQTPELQNGQQGTLDDGTQVGTQNTVMENANTGSVGQVSVENPGMNPELDNATTSGVHNVSDPRIGRSLTSQEADELLREMQDGAQPAPEIELNAASWSASFDENNSIQTPIGRVKMGDNQMSKFFAKGREKEFGMVAPTLSNPDVIVEKNAPESNAERDTKYLFIKTFIKSDGSRFVYFESITVQKAGLEISVSSHEADENIIKREMQNGKVLHLDSRLSSGSEGYLTRTPTGEGPDLVPTSDNPKALHKDTNSAPSNQGIPRKKDGTPDYAALEPGTMFQAIAEDFGEDVAREEVARQIEIYEAKIKKLAASRSEDINVRLKNRNQIQSLQARAEALREAAGIADNSVVGQTQQPAAPTVKPTTLRDKSRALGDYLSVEDKILRDIAEGLKFRWSDNGAQRGLGTELGFSDSQAERKARFNILSNDGITVDQYAERLEHDMDSGLIPMALDSDMRSAILDILTHVRSNREAYETAVALRENDPRTSMTEEEARQQAAYEASRRGILTEAAAEQQQSSMVSGEPFTPVDDVPFYRSEAETAVASQDFSPEHRQAVEEMVTGLNQELGENVVVFSEWDELPEKIREEVRKAMEDGYVVYGLTFQDACYLYSPAITDEQTAHYVYTHELAGHKNVEAVFPDRISFVTFCNRLVDDIGVSEMAESISDAGFMNCVNDYFTNPDAINKYVLGREYIAYLTENSNVLDLYAADYEGKFSLPSLQEFITTDTLLDLIHYANSRQGRSFSQGQGRMGRTTETEADYRRTNGTTGMGASNTDRLSGGGQTADRGRSRPDGVSGSGTDYALSGASDNLSGRTSPDAGGTRYGRSTQTSSSEYQGTISGQDNAGVDSNQPRTLPAGETVTGTAESEIFSSNRFRRESAAAAYEAEIQSIIDQAKANGTYLKAPNGKPTRLSERQWAQVRTRAFKRWFGDWEKAARLRLIDALNPISVDGNPSIEQREAEAVFSNLENGKNRYDGREVVWVKNSVGKIMRHKGFDTSRLIPAIKDVFDASVPILSEAEERKTGHKEHSNFKGYHHYVGKISLDGRDYYVRFTLQEINTRKKNIVPNQLHSAFVSDVEIMSAGNRVNTGNSPATAETSTPVDVKLQNFIESSRTAVENSSKVVDENGEPMVVFHGTNSDFTAFDTKKIGIKGDVGMRGRGFYFSPNIRTGEGYGKNLLRVFLNIKNPFDPFSFSSEEEIAERLDIDKDIIEYVIEFTETGFRAINAGLFSGYLKEAGYDGVLYLYRQEVVVFAPSQIKSATDNTGEFSAGNDDIRFRRAEAAALSPEEVNERFNEELKQQIDGTLPEGHVYRLGMPSEALRSAGVPELPMELSSTRLAEKASADYKSGHPFSLEDMRNLPQALQNPIAVFDSKTRPGSKVILTELTDSQGNNFVAVTRSDIRRVAGRRVIQVNSIRSIYPKDYAQDVVNWINRGDLLKWADKEKTLDWLGKQQSNSADVAIPIQGLDVAANILENFENPTWVDKEKALDRLRISALLAEAQNNQGQTSGKAALQSYQEHSSITKILETFENPTRADGEKVAAAEEMAAELGVPVRIVRDRSEIGNTENLARDKRGAEGWHERATGEIAVVLPNCRDAAEVQKTILHEAVGHYGIPELLGRERADEFYRRVFRSLDKTTQARLMAKHGSETVAGDEYLAEMAEGNVTPSMWKRIMAAVRGFFRDVLGINLKVTDAEMRYILWRSKHNLQRARTVGEAMDTISEDIRMRVQTEREAARERKAQQLEKLRKSEPIQITGEEITPSENLKQYKKNALEYGKTLRGEYVNLDSGERISLFAGGKNGGIKEVLQHDYKNPEHLQAVAAIPQIIENSILIDSEQNQDRRVNPNVKQYAYYVVGLKIGDTDYTVKAVVAQDDNGNRYYDHKLTQIEKGTLIDGLYRLSNSVAENQDSQMGFSASSGLSSMVGAGEAEPNIRRPETGNRLQSISPIPDIKDKRLPSILQPALTEIEKGDLIVQRDLVKAQVYDDKAANAVTGTPVSTVKDKRLLQILQPEPLKYQAESTQNKQQEPQTPMQYVDRVAEEMAALDNEIRLRRNKQQPAADAPIRTTRENWATRIGRKLQDAHIPVRQLQDYVRAHGGKTGIETDVYSALNRALGRQMERIRRVDADFSELGKKMNRIKREYGYSYKQIEEYLAAKSSLERHASGTPAYSEQADAPWNKWHVEETVDRFEKTVPAKQRYAMWADIRTLAQKQLEMMRQYGLISIQTLRDIQARGWKYYLPLQGMDFDFEQVTDPHDIFGEILNDRKGGRSSLMHRAKGRTTKPDDVLATLQRNIHLTIMSGEQNLAKQFLLRLAEANPELQGDTRRGEGVFEIEERWWVRRDENRITPEERERGEVYEESRQRPDDLEIEQSQIAAAEMRKLESELQEVEKELWKLDPETTDNDLLSTLLDQRRELSERIDQAFDRITAVRQLPRGAHAYRGLSQTEEQEHAVPVYRNGIRTVVRLSDPIVAQAINGDFKELFGGIMKNVVNVIGKGTRWMASTSTSWNPEFLLKNTVRDSLWATFYNAVDSEGSARGYLRNYPVAQKAIVRYHSGKARPLTLNERAQYNIYTPEGAAAAIEEFGLSRVRDSWFDDFLMEGGLTGYAYMQEVSDYSKKLARKVRWAASRGGRTVGTLREVMETVNDLSEVTTRFSTFLSQIQKGEDVRTAVNYARDITINFNRKGEWGRDLNSLFMFFNAATQGIANFYNLTRRNKARMGFAMAGVLGLSYTMSLLLAQFLAADDDDEQWFISDYQRYTNLCIPGWIIGRDDKVVLIPLPQELRPIWVAGTVAADVTGGRIDAKDAWGVFSNATGTVLEAAGEAYLPVEISMEHPMKTFVPSVFKPMYELHANADFTGFPICREPFAKSLEGRIPESQLGMRNANKFISGVTEWLNEVGGGNQWTPAGIDPEIGNINGLVNLLDQNPSKIEHLLTSYTGGLGRMGARIYRYVSSPDEERAVRDIPFINAFLTDVRKEINPNTEYYDIRDKYESLNYWFRKHQKEGTYPPFYHSDEEAQKAAAEVTAVMQMIKQSDKTLDAWKKQLEMTEYGSEQYRAVVQEMNRVKKDFIHQYDQLTESTDHAAENR